MSKEKETKNEVISSVDDNVKHQTMPTSSIIDEQREAVLVVGDWVVDEYWFLVRHYSDISSHTGFVHYRLACDKNDPISGLCAAGHVARVFFQLLNEDKEKKGGCVNTNNFGIIGIGKWHANDTEHIKHLIHSKGKESENTVNLCDAATANFKISHSYCEEPSDIHLQTLDPDSPTTRVVRMYHQKNGGLEQINRVDWEEDNKDNKVKEIDKKNLEQLEALEKTLRIKVKYIVIHDSRKGVVTPDLIDKLNTIFTDAEWFVRSKSRKPEWLESIRDKLKILFIGPEIASNMSPWDSWIIKGNTTDTALEGMGKLPWDDTSATPFDPNGTEPDGHDKRKILTEPIIILISNQHEIIVRTRDYYYTGFSGVVPNSTSQLGWPSAFFASMVHVLCTDRNKSGDDKVVAPECLESKIEWALKKADNYGGVDLPRRNFQLKKYSERELVVYFANRVKTDTEWKYAHRGYGIINEGKVRSKLKEKLSEDLFNKEYPTGPGESTSSPHDVLRLDVWRSTTLLPGYISCISEKRVIINRIGRRLKSFASTENPVRSLSIMLQADPGSGKTLLAKLLAKLFDFEFIRYDITQMIHRDELLDLFDSVATMQANTRKKVLVFVDEINAFLDGSHAYGAFLAPLEEGIYIRRGNYFSLKPCVWVFAGTNLDDASLSSDEKLGDFKSRMELIERIDYKSLSTNSKSNYAVELQSQARLEQVYLGATLIKQFFSDVQEVSYEVLKYFYRMNPADAPARKIRKLAASLQNVQYGRISRENCNNWENEYWQEVDKNSKEDQMYVKLVFLPPPPSIKK